jgi:hypothetical protein
MELLRQCVYMAATGGLLKARSLRSSCGRRQRLQSIEMKAGSGRQSSQVSGRSVFRAINNSQIFAAAYFDCRLN